MKKVLGDTSAYFARKTWYRNQLKALSIPREDSGRRRLLVDVSLIATWDARTGIQRVVRGIWATLLRQAGEFELLPVVASRTHGYSPVAYAADGTFGRPNAITAPVETRSGDIFLGLDLSAHLLPTHAAQVEQWKAAGVTIAIVCYDLLPQTHPQFFTARTRNHFARWIDWVLRTADAIFCISDDVARQIASRLADLRISPLPATYRLSLGGNLLASIPSLGIRPGDAALLERLGHQSAMLMVGTIEPRKGYSVALDAFDKLWLDGADYHLVIIGKVGWKARSVLTRLRRHPQLGKRLHWIEDASDEFLDRLYQTCSGLLVTAHAEGYCLPIVEAAKHGLPVLARDIPVLREHDYANPKFFQEDGGTELAAAILSFLVDSGLQRWCRTVPAWIECGEALLRDLGLAPNEFIDQAQHRLCLQGQSGGENSRGD